MNTKSKTWLTFVALAVISMGIWIYFSYPQFSFIDLSIDRKGAVKIADNYLSGDRKVDLSGFSKVSVFISDGTADRYLQKTLGFTEEKEFIQQHNYDLFMWLVRYFKESEREEYRLIISAATGKVISLKHSIAETEAREPVDVDEAKIRAAQFLEKNFGLNLENYTLHSQLSTKRDNRTDHAFTWEKNNVYVPWSDEPDTGGAKLMTGATISGNETLTFYKNNLKIPEKFSRDIRRLKSTGNNLSTLFSIFYLIILTASTYFVIARRNHLAMHAVKNFLIALTVVLFILSILDHANGWQSIILGYKTTSSMASYLWSYLLHLIIATFFVTIGILMPGLAGESVHYETLSQRKSGSFLYYINSTFLARGMLQTIVLGYLTAMIMLGIQSAAFQFGRQYLGVWVERPWITQLSSSYLPFLAAFFLGIKASLTEEITFRIFAISWLKKIKKSIVFAVIVSSIIWGFGHSSYPVFPMWFRGIEVTFLGLFLAFVYLRHGIIAVLVAHYVFDVFWSGANMFLGKTSSFNFYSMMVILLLPLGWGVFAYLINKPEVEHKMRWKFNKHQTYNLRLLKYYFQNKENYENKSHKEIREELVSHGWDVAVIEEALEKLKD